MIYDPHNREFFFSEEMQLSENGSRQFNDHYRAWQNECISNPSAWVSSRINGSEDKAPKSLLVGLLPGLAIMTGIIAMFMSIKMKRYDIMAWIMAAVLFLPGIITLVAPGEQAAKYQAVTSSKLNQRILGAILIAGAAAVAVIRVTASDTSSIDYLLTVFFALSVTIFLLAATASAGMFSTSGSIYREEVNATVIGYLRTYEDAGGHGIYNPVVSPVFEYYHNGNKYQAAYDVFYPGRDSSIPPGGCSIRICPDHPERVKGNTKRMTSTPIAFALFSLAAAIVIGIFLFG